MYNVYAVPYDRERQRGAVEQVPGLRSEHAGRIVDARGTGEYDYGEGYVLVAARCAAEALTVSNWIPGARQ